MRKFLYNELCYRKMYEYLQTWDYTGEVILAVYEDIAVTKVLLVRLMTTVSALSYKQL